MPMYYKEIIDFGVGLRNLQGKDWLFGYFHWLLSMKSKYAYIFCDRFIIKKILKYP